MTLLIPVAKISAVGLVNVNSKTVIVPSAASALDLYVSAEFAESCDALRVVVLHVDQSSVCSVRTLVDVMVVRLVYMMVVSTECR